MESLKEKVIEIERVIELVREMLLKKVEKLRDMKEGVSFYWLKEDLMDLLTILSKYVDLLVRLRREFSDIYEERFEDEVIELVWDVRLLDKEDRERVKEFVRGILKERFGGRRE